MGAVLMERHDLIGARRPLFSKERYTNAITEAEPKLIEIAYEQINLLSAS
jgi:hypothetical protein